MDGRYPSNSYVFTGPQKALIRTWIQEALSEKSWEEALDLHVDEICIAGHYKEFWLDLSISLAHQANVMLQEMHISHVIGIVVMPLYADEEEPMGHAFQRWEDIAHDFDLTPPHCTYTL